MLALVPYASPAQELWWRRLPGVYNRFPVRELTKEEKSAAGLLVKSRGPEGTPAVPAGEVTKSASYIPPHLRKEGSNCGAVAPAGAAPGAGAKPALSEAEKKTKSLMKKGKYVAADKLKNLYFRCKIHRPVVYGEGLKTCLTTVIEPDAEDDMRLAGGVDDWREGEWRHNRGSVKEGR